MRLVLPKLTSIRDPNESLISDATANHFFSTPFPRIFFFGQAKIIENIYRASGVPPLTGR